VRFVDCNFNGSTITISDPISITFEGCCLYGAEVRFNLNQAQFNRCSIHRLRLMPGTKWNLGLALKQFSVTELLQMEFFDLPPSK
jgi:hypothetical protein